MSRMVYDSTYIRSHGACPHDFCREIQEKVEEIEAAGGEGIAVQTDIESDYGHDYAVLGFHYHRPETEKERKVRETQERRNEHRRRHALMEEAKRLGYKLEKE